MIYDCCNCLSLEQFSSVNCFFKSHIVLTANIFCHMSLPDFIFLRKISQLAVVLKGNCLFSTFDVEKPTALLVLECE
jgi:hypothetical protein